MPNFFLSYSSNIQLFNSVLSLSLALKAPLYPPPCLSHSLALPLSCLLSRSLSFSHSLSLFFSVSFLFSFMFLKKDMKRFLLSHFFTKDPICWFAPDTKMSQTGIFFLQQSLSLRLQRNWNEKKHLLRFFAKCLSRRKERIAEVI